MDELDSLVQQFGKESDRACVILVAVLLDNTLKRILRATLAQVSGSDTLFDGYSPIGTFAARIDCAYKLGLISGSLCGDLHKIRKLRNDFAHDVEFHNFDLQSAKDRVSSLKTSLGPVVDILDEELAEDASVSDLLKGPVARREFLYCAGLILHTLKEVEGNTAKTIEAEKENLYG